MIRCGHISAAAVTLERFVAPLVPRMRDLGVESFFVTGGHEHVNSVDWDAPVLYSGIGRGKEIWKGWVPGALSLEEIHNLSPDVVFVHTPASALATWPLLRRLRSSGVRLVYVARGSLDESSSRAIRSAWAVTDPMKWGIWASFIVANEYLAQRAAQLHPRKAVVHASLGAAWPNTPASEPERVDLEPWQARGHVRLGWVGRLDADKRPEDFGRLIAELNVRLGLPTQGVMVGSALSGDRGRSLTSSANIEMVGWQEHPWQFLAECDLNISTSIREGYGLSPVEAASVGTPTIAYANHGMAESVPEVLGDLVPHRGLVDMARLVMKYSRQPHDASLERRRAVARAAWNRLAQADPAAEFVEAAVLALSA